MCCSIPRSSLEKGSFHFMATLGTQVDHEALYLLISRKRSCKESHVGDLHRPSLKASRTVGRKSPSGWGQKEAGRWGTVSRQKKWNWWLARPLFEDTHLSGFVKEAEKYHQSGILTTWAFDLKFMQTLCPAWYNIAEHTQLDITGNYYWEP